MCTVRNQHMLDRIVKRWLGAQFLHLWNRFDCWYSGKGIKSKVTDEQISDPHHKTCAMSIISITHYPLSFTYWPSPSSSPGEMLTMEKQIFPGFLLLESAGSSGKNPHEITWVTKELYPPIIPSYPHEMGNIFEAFSIGSLFQPPQSTSPHCN